MTPGDIIKEPQPNGKYRMWVVTRLYTNEQTKENMVALESLDHKAEMPQACMPVSIAEKWAEGFLVR